MTCKQQVNPLMMEEYRKRFWKKSPRTIQIKKAAKLIKQSRLTQSRQNNHNLGT